MVIYASWPQQQVVGEATIDEILEGHPDDIWDITKEFAGIDKRFFSSYYANRDKAIAYKLSEVKIYETPKRLSDFNITQAPQSFAYLN